MRECSVSQQQQASENGHSQVQLSLDVGDEFKYHVLQTVSKTKLMENKNRNRLVLFLKNVKRVNKKSIKMILLKMLLGSAVLR